MPWGLFGLVLTLVFVLQTAVMPFCAPASLDLLLVMALVCGLTAPSVDARLAAWIIGFVQDLDSGSPLGLHAALLALAVWALTLIRDLVNLNLWWGRWLIAALVALPARLVLQLHMRWSHGDWPRSVFETVVTAVVAGLAASIVVGLPAWWRGRRHRYRRPRRPAWR